MPKHINTFTEFNNWVKRKRPNFINEIKYAYQRVKYGYDERIKWEFDSYFNQFIPPLKEFCIEELAKDNIHLNINRKDIFTNTLKMIENWEKMPYTDVYKEINAQTILWEYIGKHLQTYWN